MPSIEPLRGLRYDLNHVASLSDVIAPPYDVISPELQDDLYRKHPANVIRLILNRDEPGDDLANNRYSRASGFLKDWIEQGMLTADSEPAVYVYHQRFTYGGQVYDRRGFMARCRLEKFGEGKIYPHEETHASAKADRLMLTRACKANLSQIFGLYPDPSNAAQELLEAAAAKVEPLEAVDHLGVVHRMWVVTDPAVIAQVQGLMADKPVFIADGHHRYETALNYRQELADAAGAPLPADHPAHCVLMMLIGMDDPGLIVMPTHRLFRGLPSMTADELAAKLGAFFSLTPAGSGPTEAQAVWTQIEEAADQGLLGLYTQADQKWTLAKITDAGRAKMDELAPEHSPAWRTLGVSILQRLVLENLLSGANLPKPKYVHLVEEVVDSLPTGEFSVSCLVMPATLAHIQEISSHLERMPAKSTYFYPKLLSGLVINPLTV